MTMRPKRKCGICADVKAAAWVHVLLEEGYSPRRIARDKGSRFSRKQIVWHVERCPKPESGEAEESAA